MVPVTGTPVSTVIVIPTIYEIVTDTFGFLNNARAAGTDAVLGLPGSCIVDGNALYIDADMGYCLAVPPRFVVGEMNPGQPAVFGPPLERSLDPLRASLLVDVKAAQADSKLESVADEFVKANPSAAISRSAGEIGGQKAVILRNVPGRLSSANVLVLNNGRLFNLYFLPDGITKAKPDLDSLNAMAMSSFGFLPSTTVGQPMPMLRDIPWQTAQEMIQGGQVKEVSQAHSLQVNLTLADGRVLHTVEPQIDEVMRVVERCGERCRGMVIATE